MASWANKPKPPWSAYSSSGKRFDYGHGHCCRRGGYSFAIKSDGTLWAWGLTDNCDPDPLIYIKGSVGSFVAGPFRNGDQVEVGHGPSLIPRQAPSTFGGNIATIQLNGDVLLWAVDSKGNASVPIPCK